MVAVLDTGIDAGHPAFEGVELISRNFTQDAPEDLHGHGTHCAATIFGRDVGGQRIGVARGIRKALIGKVLGKGSDTQSIVQAIEWAAENSDVISMSLGVDFPGYARRLRESGFPEELAVSRALEAYRANVRLYESVATLLRAQLRPTLLVAQPGTRASAKSIPGSKWRRRHRRRQRESCQSLHLAVAWAAWKWPHFRTTAPSYRVRASMSHQLQRAAASPR